MAVLRPGVVLAKLACLALTSLALAADGPQPRTDAQGDPLPPGALTRIGTMRFRLPNLFYSPLALSPDGKYIATGTQHDTISLLDTTTGLEARELKVNIPGGQGGLAFSPDGTRLVLSGFGGIQVLDVKSGLVSAVLERNARAGMMAPTFSADGKRLAIGAQGYGQKTDVKVWDLETTKPLATLEPLHNWLANVALSGDGKVLATWGQADPREAAKRQNAGQIIQLWDVATGKELRQLALESAVPMSVAIAPDGKQLTVAEQGSALSTWDVAKGALVRRQAGRRGTVAILRYAPDGKVLAAGTQDGVIQLFETSAGKRLSHARGPSCSLNAIAFVGDKVLAAGRKDQAICLWDAVSGRELSPTDMHTASVTGLAFSRDSRALVTAGDSVRWWDALSGKKVRQLSIRDEQEQMPFGSLEFTLAPHGKYLAGVRRHQGGVRIFDLEKGDELYELPVLNNPFGAQSAFSGDGKTFVAMSQQFRANQREMAVRVWDLESGQERPPLPAKAGDQATLATSPDGKLAAVAVYSHPRGVNMPGGGDVQLWDLATGKEKGKLAPDVWVTTLAFAPDCAVLATCGQGQATIALWDVATGATLRVLEAGGQQLFSRLVFSRDGRLLAAAGMDRTGRESKLVVWELASGKVRAEFSGQGGSITALALAPDGRTLASGSSDTTVLLWDLVGRLDETARRGGKLTEKELEDLWRELNSSEAGPAHRAMVRLGAAPDQTLAWFRKEIKPAAGKGLDGKEIDRLIGDLDNDSFEVREKASQALDGVGKQAKPALLKALEDKPSPEKKRRLQDLLDAMKAAGPSPELVRTLRALEVLERQAGPEAKSLLEELARGSPGARLTSEARDVLRRLTEKP